MRTVLTIAFAFRYGRPIGSVLVAINHALQHVPAPPPGHLHLQKVSGHHILFKVSPDVRAINGVRR